MSSCRSFAAFGNAPRFTTGGFAYYAFYAPSGIISIEINLIFYLDSTVIYYLLIHLLIIKT